MTRDARSMAEPLLTSAEVARLAGVTRAAVSNWRRRHSDFPQPVRSGSNGPLFPLSEVRAWLKRQNKGNEVTGEVRLWQALRAEFGDDMTAAVTAVARYLSENDEAGIGTQIQTMVDELADESGAAGVVAGLADRLLDAECRAGSGRVTPPPLIKALTHLAASSTPPSVILDPACGTGTLLLSAAALAAPNRPVVLRGQDKEPGLAALTRARALAAGRTDVEVEVGDSLRDDRWPSLRADLVVCDPPTAAPDWGREQLLLDPRWELGTPSRAENELAWLQHCYAHTAPGGRALIVMPTSVAYRKAGRRIRAELVRRGALTQVTALPPGMSAVHAQPIHIWHLQRPTAPADTAGHVRMVDLTTNAADGPWDPDPAQVAEVPLIELLDETVDLSPGGYVGTLHRDYPVEYAELRHELTALARELLQSLPEFDPGDGTGTVEGPAVSLAELARAGLVDLEADDPTSTSEQLDTDFLRGFLHSPGNTRRSTSASGTYRTDTRAARIPQMPVEQQRRYGSAFRALNEFEQRARRLAELSTQALNLAREGLGNGALEPPASED
ncbi:N-6 DNA methylase [Actinospica sp. MGRD01-02]|uniref:N-6 DNA methylase n=1 Tax=Actinospica acidithermotolerans TaxID=2828514 RepID=A0A941EF80_9ACTN|nr:N-6 DNA methylase [Actinospica acidithermotolerans]MBR7826624.1 N-6 DNA methylase [Actinospica acidithermotolerans]